MYFFTKKNVPLSCSWLMATITIGFSRQEVICHCCPLHSNLSPPWQSPVQILSVVFLCFIYVRKTQWKMSGVDLFRDKKGFWQPIFDLFRGLEDMDFGDNFIKWVQSIYTLQTACIIVNGDLTKPCRIKTRKVVNCPCLFWDLQYWI